MPRHIDLTNQVFGELTAKSRVLDSKPTKWLCECSCGKTIEITSKALRDNKRTDCGCRKPKKAKKKFNLYGATIATTNKFKEKCGLTYTTAKRFRQDLQERMEADTWAMSLPNPWPMVQKHAQALAAEYIRAKAANRFLDSDAGEGITNSMYQSANKDKDNQERIEQERLTRLAASLPMDED